MSSQEAIFNKVSKKDSTMFNLKRITEESWSMATLVGSEITQATEFSEKTEASLDSYLNLLSLSFSELTPASKPTEGHLLDVFSEDEIIERTDELQQQIQTLRTENKLFLRFLLKNEPQSLENFAKTVKQAQLSLSQTKRFGSSKVPRKSVSASAPEFDVDSCAELPDSYQIHPAHKSDLVFRAMDEIQAQHDKAMNRLKHDIFILNARTEELQTRQSEHLESIEALEKFTEANDCNVNLPKLIRFVDEWVKRSRHIVDKLRLRYSSMRVQYQKVSASYTEKLRIGENLHEIDYEHLNIENMHLVEHIETAAHIFLELRKLTGAGNLKLFQHKKLLRERLQDREALVKAIKNKEEDVVQLDLVLTNTCKELEDAKKKYKRVKGRVTKFEAPDVMEYIKLKGQLIDLKKEIKTWTNRLRLKNLALSSAYIEVKKLLGGTRPRMSWFHEN